MMLPISSKVWPAVAFFPLAAASHDLELGIAAAVLAIAAGLMTFRAHSLGRKARELSAVNETLRNAEKQLNLSRFILDKSVNAVYLIDETGIITYANAGASAMTGYPLNELVGMRVYGQLNSNFSQDEWQGRWERLTKLPKGEFEVFRTSHQKKNGSIVPVEVTAHLVKHEGQQYNLSLVLDITDRVRAEQEIANIASLSDRALELTRSGYWSVPLDGSESWIASERTLNILGMPENPNRQYTLYAWLEGMKAVDPAIAAATVEKFQQALKGEVPIYEVTFPFERPVDGKVVWLHSMGVLVTRADRREMQGVIQDITDIMEARRELEAARKAAEQANRLKSEFLANMSHEIRTPMNTILGYAQLMQRDSTLPKEQIARVEPINRAGEHLLLLLNDILEMSKIEAGRITLREAPFDLHALLDEVIDVYGTRASVKGLSLTLQREPELPRGVVSDAPKLRQALINLLSNAVKFTARGKITVKAGAEPSDGGGYSLRFAVTDTGPGIPTEELKQLFRPFVQTSSSRHTGGTGLGLAISQQYAHLLSGSISVVSEPGQGSTFILTIRAKAARQGEVESPSVVPRAARLADGQAPVRVLVVDDSPFNRDVVVAALDPMGFQTQIACDGQEAVDLFKEWHPHAVLMDMRMPGMDGYEATRIIKSTPEGRSAFILALTASAFEEDRAAILEAGADDFMRKPMKIEELLAVIGTRLKLTYVYEHAPAPVVVTQAADFSALPDAEREQILTACSGADFERLMELCDQVAPFNPSLAEELRARVNAFDYEFIARALSSQTPVKTP